MIGFSALVVAGSYGLVPDMIKEALLSMSRWFLVIAIAALGMKTSLRKLGDVGFSAIALICALTAILAVFALITITVYMT